jgi:hypothetical protein
MGDRRDRDTFLQPGVSDHCWSSRPARARLRDCRRDCDAEPERPGRHPRNGAIYFWCLAGAFLTASGLAAVRWARDYHLFILGALSFTAAYLGRRARQGRWRHWVRLHITGMGTSYILLLIAFYVDNGKSLPLWKELPPVAYWLVPPAIGIPIIVRALLWHPLHIGRTSVSQTPTYRQRRCLFPSFWKYELTDRPERERLPA